MEDYSELVKSLKACDWGRSGAPFLVVDAEIRKVAGHPELLARLEEVLLDVLRSNAPDGAKRGVAKSLSLIATDRSAPVLASMLTREEMCDMARYVLERMAPGAADATLREFLPRARGVTRIGIVNSIGNRGDSQSVATLSDLLKDSDEETAQAAACALGKIGGAVAIRALAAQLNASGVRLRAEVLDAYLVCAGRLAAAGRKSEAAAMYQQLSAGSMPAPIRRAAARALKAG